MPILPTIIQIPQNSPLLPAVMEKTSQMLVNLAPISVTKLLFSPQTTCLREGD